MSENNHDGMKKCTKCGEWKPATAEYFHRDKTRKSGLRAQCKTCRREYDREYRQKNKDKIAEYRASNIERLRVAVNEIRRKTGATIYLRDMTEEQKETLANQYVAVKTLEKTEKELLAASGKKRCSRCGGVFDFDMFYKSEGRCRAECKACENERLRKHRQQNKDHYSEYQREYRQKNKDKINERQRKYRQKKQKST